jgi:Domain of unknown function (DUF1996)
MPSSPLPTRWRRLLIVAIAAILPASIAIAASTEANALAKIKCHQTTGVATVDPIVYHNMTHTHTHSHQFFGNNGWVPLGNRANYSDLMSKATNCRVSGDTAGYWTPTLRYTATKKEIPTQAFTAYYRPWTGVGGPEFGEGRAYPQDTRLIGTKYNWSCGQHSGARSAPQSTIPDCTGLSGKPGLTLTLHIDFPSCWNGKAPGHSNSEIGDTRDNADWAYTTGSGRTKACPSTHPIKMIALRETIQFKYVGNGTDVELSSDPMMGKTDGASAHGDFWNTWQPAALASMVKNCINGTGVYTTTECDA